MALAEVGRFPFRYLVEDASSTVTFWPNVDTVKLDVDTLPTAPHTPPGSGPDRAPAGDEGDVAGEGDVAAAADVTEPAESPITVHISAAVPIHRLLLFDSDRRTAPPEVPATDGPDIALVP
jgi:hypothetical protein